jgi:hypothetical protein
MCVRNVRLNLCRGTCANIVRICAKCAAIALQLENAQPSFTVAILHKLTLADFLRTGCPAAFNVAARLPKGANHGCRNAV